MLPQLSTPADLTGFRVAVVSRTSLDFGSSVSSSNDNGLLLLLRSAITTILQRTMGDLRIPPNLATDADFTISAVPGSEFSTALY